MIFRFAAILTFCFAANSALFAGVVFEIETKDHSRSSSQPEETQVKAEGKNLVMGIPSDRNNKKDGELIYRGDRREMIVVDHDKKSYTVLDMATLKQLAGQVSSAMSQVQEALKNVPENQRAMMEKMMKDRMPKTQAPSGPKTEIRKTGKRAKHNGYPCVRYDVFEDGRKIREMWVTDWKNVEGGKEATAAFTDIGEFFEELVEAFSGAGGQGFSQMSKNMFAQMKELNGFPVVTHDFDDNGELERESTLRSSRRTKLDPADFEPPSGYKRQSMMGR